MSPIEGLSNIRRLPLLGRIRLGIKKEGPKSSYPTATDYFVCPEEVQAVYGEKPTQLRIMFPSNDMEEIASQYYRAYSWSQGLLCRGTGSTSFRKVDTLTGDFANRETKQWTLVDAGCEPDHCPMIATKQCRRVMSLFFIIPDVPGLGVYRLNTTSWFSIVNINSQLAPGDPEKGEPEGFLRRFTGGRIAFIPLILSLQPQEVTPMEVGRKTVHVLSVRAEVKLTDLITASRRQPAEVLMPGIESDLDDQEPPDDLFPEDIIADVDVVVDDADQDSSHVAEQDALQDKQRYESYGAGKKPLKDVDAGDSTSSGKTSPSDLGGGGTGDEEAPTSTSKDKKSKKTASRPPPAAITPEEPLGEPDEGVIGPAGPPTDWEIWLDGIMSTLHWTEVTLRTWIASRFKGATIDGTLKEVLGRLTHEQQETLTKELNDKASSIQPGLL